MLGLFTSEKQVYPLLHHFWVALELAVRSIRRGRGPEAHSCLPRERKKLPRSA